MSYCSRLYFRIQNIGKKKIKIFFNNHAVDDFVDDFWMINCTEDYNSCKINELVRKMLSNIITKG